MSAPVNTPASAIPKAQFDGRPLALLAGIAALGLPLIGSPSTWLTLTVAGLAMGMIVFIIASGLTLVFGLMDVLNFGHGVFIALGAFVATSVMGGMADWTGSASLASNLVAGFAAVAVAAQRVGEGAVPAACRQLGLNPAGRWALAGGV